MSEKAETEQWTLRELVDDAVATGQLTNQMINRYVYSFKQDGRDIEDLTAASFDEFV